MTSIVPVNPTAQSSTATIPATGATGPANPAFGTIPGFNANGQPNGVAATNGAASTGGSNPSQVQIAPNILSSMGNYQNAAYNNQTQMLDPQWQQAQAQFQQQMVGQGLQPGSDAYNQAYNNFMLSKQQAYTGAYNNSFQTGLAAQGQAFNQGYDNSQLANALKIAGMQKQATISSAQAAANASMSNNTQNNATNQLLGMGNLGLGQQGMDLQTLLGLSGINNSNNNLIGGAQNTLLGLIPNSNPSPVDVTGAYGINEGEQNSQYQGQVANANGQNQMIGQGLSMAMMAAMMMCDRDAKDDQGGVDPAETLQAVNKLPLHLWNYKGEVQTHLGTFAQEFNAELNLPESKGIHIIDMLGALIGSVQALTKRIENIELSRAA